MTDTLLPVQKNRVVYITYTIKDEKDDFFEKSDLPVAYVHGADKGLFHKIEAALEGRVAGEAVTVSLTPAEGFGPRLAELTFTDDIDNVPPQFRQLGAEVEFQNEHGEVKTFVVSAISDTQLTVDGNHPLAGQIVTFYVSVVGVREATPTELATGEPADSTAPTLH